MNRLGNLPGLLTISILVAAFQARAETVTTGVDPFGSAMGATAHGCLQLLTISVGEAENCMYDGGPSFIESSPGSGVFISPFGESTGPFSQAQYYDYATTPQSFDNVPFPSGDPNDFVPAPADGKIRQVINGSITIDDSGDGFGANDLISFTLTMTSPNGGDIVRNLGGDVADRYTSMTQVLGPTPVDSATPNADGGFDYVIGSEGFPVRLEFIDASANESAPGAGDGPCVGQMFGDMECSASFAGNGNTDPLRWMPWLATDSSTITPPPVPHMGPPQSPGIGSLENNIGPRASGSLVNAACAGAIGESECTESKTSFAPLAIGPDETPGGPGVTAEDVGWDHVYLQVSTDADGNVLSAEGFDVQEYQVFGQNALCGNDPLATIVCNSWLAGHFTIAGAMAVDDIAETPFDTPITIDVLGNDTGFVDPVTVSLPGGGTSTGGGAIVINGANPGPQAGINITYTPSLGFSGTDTFDYTVNDGTTTSTAMVTVDVLFGATDDSASTRLNTSENIAVGANDFGFVDPVTVTVTVAPNMGGSIDAINGGGGPAANVTIDYTPAAALGTGTYTETFSYQVTDANMNSDTAVVTVTVNNEVPNAVAANASAGEGQSAVIDVATLPAANLGDAPSTVAVTRDAADGMVSVTGSVITYTPSGLFTGSDSYEYTITDADGETSTATVSVAIGPKLVPTATADSAAVDQGGSVPIDVTGNDIAGSGTLANHTVMVTSFPSSGTATAGGGNLVTYTPAADFSGIDSFQYTLTDVDGDTSVTTVTVTVTATGSGPALSISPELPSASAIDPWTVAVIMLVPYLRHRQRQQNSR